MTDRPTLVLVPGLLCDDDLFAAQVEALRGDGVHVVVPDLSGPSSTAGMAVAVLAAAPDRFWLAGLSMGGYVALELVARAPDAVQGLALLDTSARPDTAEQRARREELVRIARAEGLGPVLARLWPLEVARSRVLDAALRARFDAMARRLGVEVFERQQRAIMARADSRPRLADVAVPALVLCGREDALTPVAVHEELAAALPRARLVVLEDCGHLSTMEQPDAVTAHLRSWLGA